MTPYLTRTRRWFRFSLRTMFVAIFIASLIVLAVLWLRPIHLDVVFATDDVSLCQYDDHDGHFGKAAMVKVTNFSNSTVWFHGYGGVPDYTYRERINGTLNWHASSIRGNSSPQGEWCALRRGETVTILAGPISDQADEFSIGVPFTGEKFNPTTVHWIFSPYAKIVRGPQFDFPVMARGMQEVQLVPVSSPTGRPVP
jgi:hypothetical protein